MSFKSVLLFAGVAAAHFKLDYPSSIGFDEDKEPTGPCGGFDPDFSSDNVTDFHVGGDSIATNLLHTQGTWLYRGTLDTTGASNWTQLFPEVLQSGLGYFCQPEVTVPSSWAGKKGVLSVAVDAPDGVLFQCAAVNFVTGKGTAPSTCTNSSGITASFTEDANLASLTSDNSTSEASGTASAGSSTASSTASSTSSASAAATTSSAAGGRLLAGPPSGALAGVVSVVMAAAMAGAVLVL